MFLNGMSRISSSGGGGGKGGDEEKWESSKEVENAADAPRPTFGGMSGLKFSLDSSKLKPKAPKVNTQIKDKEAEKKFVSSLDSTTLHK